MKNPSFFYTKKKREPINFSLRFAKATVLNSDRSNLTRNSLKRQKSVFDEGKLLTLAGFKLHVGEISTLIL